MVNYLFILGKILDQSDASNDHVRIELKLSAARMMMMICEGAVNLN